MVDGLIEVGDRPVEFLLARPSVAPVFVGDGTLRVEQPVIDLHPRYDVHWEKDGGAVGKHCTKEQAAENKQDGDSPATPFCPLDTVLALEAVAPTRDVMGRPLLLHSEQQVSPHLMHWYCGYCSMEKSRRTRCMRTSLLGSCW